MLTKAIVVLYSAVGIWTLVSMVRLKIEQIQDKKEEEEFYRKWAELKEEARKNEKLSS